MLRLLFLALLLIANGGVIAQLGPTPDRILLMNGQELDARVLGQSSLEVRYLIETKRGLRERVESTESIFSVTDSLGHERIWYFQDSIFGNDMTVEQMRWFIKGEQDARTGYRPLWPMLGGAMLGAGLTMGLGLEVNSLLLPPLYSAAMAIPRVHITPGSIGDESMVGNDYYAYGYAKVGRSKRVVRTLVSTAVGVVVGLAVRQFIIDPNVQGYP